MATKSKATATKATATKEPTDLSIAQVNRWVEIIKLMIRLVNKAIAEIAPTWRLIPEKGINSIIVQPVSSSPLNQTKDRAACLVKGAGYKLVLPGTLLDDPEKASTATRENKRTEVTLDIATDIHDNVAACKRILTVLFHLMPLYNRGQEKLNETIAEIMAHVGVTSVPGEGKKFTMIPTKALMATLADLTSDLGRWPTKPVTYKATRKSDGNRHGILLTCSGDKKKGKAKGIPCMEKPVGGGKETPYSFGRFNRQDNIDMALAAYPAIACPHCGSTLTYNADKLVDQRKRPVEEIEVKA
jgi:hypothetical protein